MSRPPGPTDLIALIRRSGLVAAPRLDGLVDEVAAGTAPADPAGLLDRMVGDGLLTRFQAAQLAAGRWKGFAVGGYRLLDRLGGGGMGNVYLADGPADGPARGDRVAVKVLAAAQWGDGTARKRMAREARAAAAVAHPNIVRVLAVDADADPPFLVMEFVEGVSLQAAVARAGTFAAGAAAACGRQAAAGLQAVADAGLVHRDVKPGNVLVDRRGAVKILDLGIVRVVGEEPLTLNRSGRTILGTVDYLAPEQVTDGEAVDARADQYALGGTLYFLLAGHPPFPDGTASKKLVAKISSDPRPIARLRPDIPPALAAVVHRLLARNPADRYPTAAAVAAALAPVADEAGVNLPAGLFASAADTIDDPGAPTQPVPAPSSRPTQTVSAPTARVVVAPHPDPDAADIG